MSINKPENVDNSIQSENKEMDESQIEVLAELKTLIKGVPKLHCPDDDDDFILRFLRAKNFNVQRAFELLQNYYSTRKLSCLKNTVPSTMKHVYDMKCLRFIKGTDGLGRRTLLIHLKYLDPQITVSECLIYLILLFEELLRDVHVQEKGILVVCDVYDLTFKHIMSLSVTALKLIAAITYRSMPIKIKCVLIVNHGRMFDILWTIVRSVLSEKMKSRFRLLKDHHTELHQLVDPAKLPEDFKGCLPNGDSAYDTVLEDSMFRHEDHYREYLKFGFKN